MTDFADRHARGPELMEATQGVEATQSIRGSFAGICPEFADYIVEAKDTFEEQGVSVESGR